MPRPSVVRYSAVYGVQFNDLPRSYIKTTRFATFKLAVALRKVTLASAGTIFR